MNMRRNFKIIVLLLALALQGAVISGLCETVIDRQPHQVTGKEFNNLRIQFGMGETPEAGTIWLLGLGYFLVRKRKRNRRS